jgi:hypothetical protein
MSLLLCFFISLTNRQVLAAAIMPENELKIIMEDLYNKRSAALVSGDTSVLAQYFDTSKKYGKWALEHELKRVNYLRDWSQARKIKLMNIQSAVRIKKVYPLNNMIKASLEETYKFDYIYEDDPTSANNSFGVGIRHTVTITPKEDKWLIYNDWYTDCFEDALHSYSAHTTLQQNLNSIIRKFPIECSTKTSVNLKSGYNREKAVAYADKYCGAAWGSGNNFKYNNKYIDYNGIGGDCTNFASQVLGDKEGGGLPIVGSWTPGSRAWANADGLKNFIISSGRGYLIKAGTFKELTSPSENLQAGAIGKLKLGDLVAYEKGRGNIDHFAVITGFDSKGYPLVNSHTTDRYHVPWDLGWGDKRIRFFLIHIN